MCQLDAILQIPMIEGGVMPKEEWGVKRVCPTTGKRFYDLNKNPIVSPYTGEVVTLDTGKASRSLVAEKPKPKPAAAAKAAVVDDDDDDDLVVEDDLTIEDDDDDLDDDDVLDDDEDDDTVALDDLTDVAVKNDDD